jgi:hypothetical protein
VADRQDFYDSAINLICDLTECDLNAIDARKSLMKSAGEGQPMKRTARMFDDRATPRSPFVVAYSPRSHPDTPTDSSLSSTLRPQFAIPAF